MKLTLLLAIFIIGFAQISTAQVTVQSLNFIVPCCDDTDSIDIENDGLYDISASSMFYFDAA